MGVTTYDDGLSVLKNPHIVTDVVTAAQIPHQLVLKDKFSFDVEASSLYFHEAHHHGVAVATDTDEWYITYGVHKAFYREAAKVNLFTRRWSFMHNAAYDVPFIRRHIPGIEVKVFCTLLAQHTIDENQGLGLKPLAQAKLGAPRNLADFAELQKEAAKLADIRGHKKMRVWDFNFEHLAYYAMRDVRYTYDLGLLSAKELREIGLWDVFTEYIMPVFPLIVEMEDAGVYIDRTKLAEVTAEYKAELSRLQTLWDQKTDNVNPRSTQQMSALLYDRLDLPIIANTASGNPSTSSKTIQRLKDRLEITEPEHPLNLFIEISKLQTLVNVLDTTDYSIEPNGRVYGKFNQTGARTGRMSSSGMDDIHGNKKGLNNQNIPSHTIEAVRVRETWAAPPGKLLAVLDYSQLELRLAAHFMAKYIYLLQSKGQTTYRTWMQRYNSVLQVPEVPQLLQVFKDGKDPHQMTADAVGAPRAAGKTTNFGTFYGMGPNKFIVQIELATGIKYSMKDAKKFLSGFSVAYPEYPIWQDAVLRYCERLGYVQTITGRRRRLPAITSSDWGEKSRAQRQAVNSIIQGSAADIMNLANLNVYRLIQTTPFYSGMRCIGQVHDELAVEGTKEQLEHIFEPMERIMVGAGEHFNLLVKLDVDGGIGPNWKEAK